MRIASTLLLLLATAVWLPLRAQPAEDDPLFEEQAEIQLRELWIRVRPELLAPPGACDDFGLEDLDVEVAGRRIDHSRLQGLVREPRPSVHALLIDTSASAAGRIDYFREAVARYVDRLDPALDRALLMTFDESVVLQHPVSRDRHSLRESAGEIRLGGSTALHDGLMFAMHELETHHERPLLLLLTDGVDTASTHSRADVHQMLAQNPDLAIFVIAVGLPPISGGGPSGSLSSRRFLQKLASDSNGKYFEIGTAGRVTRMFNRIRSMLGREALLTFTDHAPSGESRKIRVRSRHPDCRVLTYVRRPHLADARHRPLVADERRAGIRRKLLPPDSRRLHYNSRSKLGMDPECEAADEALWFLESVAGGARGCLLDITMEAGLLYSTDDSGRVLHNGWLKQKTRPVSIAFDSPDALPASPVEWLDAFATEATRLGAREVEIDPRQIPREKHARPHHDVSTLVHGKLFFELRAALARVAFQQTQYRSWVAIRLEQRAARELEQHMSRLRERAPALSSAMLLEIARESIEGQAILARAASPSEVDLQEFLAAWLGDISAHDLFRGWERREVNRMLLSESTDSHDFTAAWQAARKLFFVPSYSRVLTVLAPIHDREAQRIGYFRVVLPRPSWMLSRIKNWKRRIDFSGLPLDLVPDLPLAAWLVSQPEIRRELEQIGGEVLSLRYELTGKPYTWGPERAFNQSRITLELADGDGARQLSYDVVVERGVPRLR